MFENEPKIMQFMETSRPYCALVERANEIEARQLVEE